MPDERPPRIVIKFHGTLNDSDALRYDYLLYLKDEELALFNEKFPSFLEKMERLFVSVTPHDIQKLAQDIRERRGDYKIPLSFLTYFSIVCLEADKLTEVVQLLSQFSSVETAYVAPVPADPSVTNPTLNGG